MPDVAPLRMHISRRYGFSPLRLDIPQGRWTTCEGRSPGSQLERLFPTFPATQCRPPVAYAENDLPLTVAGAASASAPCGASPCSLFIVRTPECPNETVAPIKRNKADGESTEFDRIRPMGAEPRQHGHSTRRADLCSRSRFEPQLHLVPIARRTELRDADTHEADARRNRVHGTHQ